MDPYGYTRSLAVKWNLLDVVVLVLQEVYHYTSNLSHQFNNHNLFLCKSLS